MNEIRVGVMIRNEKGGESFIELGRILVDTAIIEHYTKVLKHQKTKEGFSSE